MSVKNILTEAQKNNNKKDGLCRNVIDMYRTQPKELIYLKLESQRGKKEHIG